MMCQVWYNPPAMGGLLDAYHATRWQLLLLAFHQVSKGEDAN